MSLQQMFFATSSKVSFSDNFNRANGSLGANWTTVRNTLSISSNQCYAAFNSKLNIAAYTGQFTRTNDQYVKIKLNSGSSNGTMHFMFRYTNNSSPCYVFYVYMPTGDFEWQYCSNAAAGPDNGPGSQSSLSLSDGDTLGITISGTGSGVTMRVWQNPVADAPESASSWDGVGALVSPNYPGTALDPVGGSGVAIGSETALGAVYLDDFYGGDI